MSFYLDLDDAEKSGERSGGAIFDAMADEIDPSSDEPEELASGHLETMEDNEDGPFSSEDASEDEKLHFKEGFIAGFAAAYRKKFGELSAA